MRFPLVVLIATTDRPSLLRRTLASLAACEKPASYREALVVENGPNWNAEQIVLEFAESLNARYLHVREPNKSNALNRALESLTDNCLVFFTDDDGRLATNTLVDYARYAEHCGPGWFFGGPTAVDYERPPPQWLVKFLPPSARGSHLDPSTREIHGPVFLGFNWSAFRGDLRRVGPFSVHRGPGAASGATGQETDMQERLLQHGIRASYVPDALAWHFVPRDRCSQRWALGRTYRDGVGQGLMQRAPVVYLLGYPRWALRLWVRRLSDVVLQLLIGSAETRFLALWRFSNHCGFLKGCRLASSSNGAMKPTRESAGSPGA